MSVSSSRFLERRHAGVLLHPTSLPGPWRCGNLGPEADRFLGFLQHAGLHVWQTLPLGPPNRYHCPYQASSIFAGNPALISPELLHQDGLVDAAKAAPSRPGDGNHEAVRLAATNFFARGPVYRRAEYANFLEAQAEWLPDYALYQILKRRHSGLPWYQWPEPLRDRHPHAIKSARQVFDADIRRCCFTQFIFARQWTDLRARAATAGVSLFGDTPLFVAHDSADTWSHRELFCLHAGGRLEIATGVPPDYFSVTGQYWGNPAYRWERLAEDHYAWWASRLRYASSQFDILRLDHFRGFAAYWAIPGEARTAQVGTWRPGPGKQFFDELGSIKAPRLLIAEDLGYITPDVVQLRQALGLPGMRVLQFAFDGSADNPHLPANHTLDNVIYTGTHDNDTTLGWWLALDPVTRDHILKTLGETSEPMPWALITAAVASVGFMAVIPMQDWLALDSASRMNTPGRATRNWCWRFHWNQVSPGLEDKIQNLLQHHKRLDAAPYPLAETPFHNHSMQPVSNG
ncbi:MAG: 4-alpha-glucanotransferase [Gammaproteobacteria bacterium]